MISQFSERIAVVQALRRGLDKCAHHKTFSKRIRPYLENELEGYIIHIGTCSNRFELNTVSVWGNGLTYDNRIHLSWSGSNPWEPSFREALDIADDTDYVERQKMEAMVVSSGRLDELQKRIIAIQAEAAYIFEQMPIPKSATIRAGAHFWDKPSYAIRKRYEKLFP